MQLEQQEAVTEFKREIEIVGCVCEYACVVAREREGGSVWGEGVGRIGRSVNRCVGYDQGVKP